MRLRVFLLLPFLMLGACSRAPDGTYQGWVEANFIFVSTDESGRVVRLNVQEGDRLQTGAPVFAVDDDIQQAALKQANATMANAQQTFDRAQQLAKTGAGTQRDLDAAVSSLRVAEAQVNTAQTRLARRSVASPVTGVVQQIYFRVGETVPAGRPVVAVLPPDNLKIRFFVPEAQLPKIAIGESITIACDGCTSPLTAKVRFIARSAEYTPPVIYSQEERSKLVYLIEARPDQPEALRVGQPVSVKLGAS